MNFHESGLPGRRWRVYNNWPSTEKENVICSVPSHLKSHVGRGNEGHSWGGREKITKKMKNKRGSEHLVFLRINLLDIKKSSNFDWGLDFLLCKKAWIYFVQTMKWDILSPCGLSAFS